MKIISVNINGVASEVKQEWLRGIRRCNKIDVLGIQETKASSMDNRLCRSIWGGNKWDYVQLPAIEASGGIVTIWNKDSFAKEDNINKCGLVAIHGTWKNDGSKVGFINVYAPQTLVNKKRLWNEIESILMQNPNVKWVVFGDFNEVRRKEERKGTNFCVKSTSVFNDFIHNASLIEVTSGGKKFTRYSKHDEKLSLLDRFLVNKPFLDDWPNPHALIMPRGFSDHCPIMFNIYVKDFGPTSFKLYNTWLEDKSFRELVIDNWDRIRVDNKVNPISRFMFKTRKLKKRIKDWLVKYKKHAVESKDKLNVMAESWDQLAKSRLLNESEKRMRDEVDLQRWNLAKKRIR